MNYKDIQVDLIHTICRQASDAIISVYNQLIRSDIGYKSDNSPVTQADLLSDDIIRKGLQSLYPDIPVISEEGEIPEYKIRKNWEQIWMVDPLDGTTGFIKKTGEFAINIAFIHKNNSCAGFIFTPTDGNLYYAIKDQGAFLIRDNKAIQLRARTFKFNDPGLRVLVSRHHQESGTSEWIHSLNHPEIIISGGSKKFVQIASGEADYYPRMTQLMEWDTAAGQIIIEESGGKFINASNGEKISYNSIDLRNPAFIASGNVLNSLFQRNYF
ncbi:MAG: 3'(2'),5'-bisphosphate nucleotidase CysQ [Saprospiraceae bacterium]|nr:3'(2'),5'-bisphosphate nucleotidase CysQ [Saprospiraceae bacterium]